MAHNRNIGTIGTGLGGQTPSIASLAAVRYTAFGESQFIAYQFYEAEVMSINFEGESASEIGAITFRCTDQESKAENTLSTAYPINSALKLYPVLHEIVYIADLGNGHYYMSAINRFNYINNNAMSGFTEVQGETSNVKSGDYQQLQAMQIPNTPTDKKKSTLGETFKDSRSRIAILRPNEGDYIFQGRFGNSIRLGNNPQTNSPSIKINLITDRSDAYSIFQEDLDSDAAIWLTSDEPLAFEPAGIQINPESSPPKKLDGKQIILTSDRIILNSKVNEIVMMSNKSIHLAMNNDFSVDSGANIRFTAKENLVIKSKKIYLGSAAATEKLILGTTLIRLLKQLLDALATETHNITAVGAPSGPPINAPMYAQIRAQLDYALSKANFTL